MIDKVDPERLLLLRVSLTDDRILGLTGLLQQQLADLRPDDPGLLKTLHRLIGSAETLGFRGVAAPLRSLEARAGQQIPVDDALAALVLGATNLEAAMRTALHDGGSKR